MFPQTAATSGQKRSRYLQSESTHTEKQQKAHIQGIKWILCMEHASFQRRRFPGQTQVLHHKQNCFPMFQEFLTADHSQWKKYDKKSKSSKKCTCKTVAFRAALEVFKLQVLSTRFSVLCYAISTRFNGFTPSLFLPFLGKTWLGTLDDLRIGGETSPRRTSLRAVSVMWRKDSRIMGSILTIHHCILSWFCISS